MTAAGPDMSAPDAVCPLCGGAMTPWFSVPGDWRVPDCARVFEIKRCKRDEFSRIHPMPQQEELNRHYEIEEYYTRAPGAAGALKKTSLFSQLREKIALALDHGLRSGTEARIALYERIFGKEAADILDIGCGGGDAVRMLSDRGHRVTGLEPDPNAKSRRADFGVPVFDGAAERIPDAVSQGGFDFIIMNHVFEHCRDVTAASRNVKELLNQNGSVYIEVPNTACLDFYAVKLAWAHLDVPRHTHLLTEKSLRRCLEQAGLEIQAVYYRNFHRQFSPAWTDLWRPILEFYRTRGAYKWTLKDFGPFYYWGLLLVTAFAPRRWKYDSVAVVAFNPEGEGRG